MAWRAARWLAGGLLALLAGRALALPDRAYDAFSYHLPFAARSWGLIPRQSLELDDHLERLYGSYPLLAEWLEGALWLVFGRPQAANLLGLGSLVALVVLLARRFSVPWAASTIALLAIPLVQIHATSAYVDLPTNVALTVSVLLAVRAWAFPDDTRDFDFVLGMGGAAVAASMKFTALPVAACSFAVHAGLYMQRSSRTAGETLRRAATVALAFALLGSVYLKNWVVWGDPIYPLQLSGPLGIGHGGMLIGFEGPDQLRSVAGPIRWLLSVLGYNELDPQRDYWNTDSSSATSGLPSFRMGGYFGGWVLANLVLLGLLAWVRRDRPARGAVVAVGALSLVVAVLPGSHQLRYHMCWMLVLVSLNLCLLSETSGHTLSLGRYVAGAAVTLAVVVALTRGHWLVPARLGHAWSDLVVDSTRSDVFMRLRPGGRYCLVGSLKNVLPYTAELRGLPSYSLKSAADASQCAGREVIALP